MTLSLALVRHAKSDWADPALDDADRPLNERGYRDARAMAARLKATGFAPQRILASTALRARTTADFFGAETGLVPELVADLYGARSAVILDAVRTSGASSLIVVAHDPGMSDAVDQLSDGEWEHMPTCAVAVFGWDGDDWESALATPADRKSFDAPR